MADVAAAAAATGAMAALVAGAGRSRLDKVGAKRLGARRNRTGHGMRRTSRLSRGSSRANCKRPLLPRRFARPKASGTTLLWN
eukprot:2380713-Pleurochrysis_carterae.AAC.1